MCICVNVFFVVVIIMCWCSLFDTCCCFCCCFFSSSADIRMSLMMLLLLLQWLPFKVLFSLSKLQNLRKEEDCCLFVCNLCVAMCVLCVFMCEWIRLLAHWQTNEINHHYHLLHLHAFFWFLGLMILLHYTT